MGGFKAEHAVEALDFDFRPVGEAHGTIAEPTQERLDQFFASVKELAQEAGSALAEDAQPGEVAQAIDSLADSDSGLDGLTRAIADLCDGSPTYEEINALPVRYQAAFRTWLLNEIVDPSSPQRATRPGPVRRNGAGLLT